MKAARLETQEGVTIYVNPEFVMMLTPTYSTGAAVLGQCDIYVAGAKIVVKGSIEEVAEKLWSDKIHKVDLVER